MALSKKAQILRDMDNCIRMCTDEENGIFDTWITLYVPDEATDEELEEFAEDDLDYYHACEFFARNIADMVVNGEWTKNGFSAEFYKPSEDKRFKQAPSSSHADVREFLDKAREAKASLEKSLIEMCPILSTENKEDKSAED